MGIGPMQIIIIHCNFVIIYGKIPELARGLAQGLKEFKKLLKKLKMKLINSLF